MQSLFKRHESKNLANTSNHIIKPKCVTDDAEESLDVWGFRDTRFLLNEAGCVELSGNRYPLCGHPLPSLLPWIREVMHLELDPSDLNFSAYPPKMPPHLTSAAFEAAIAEFLTKDQLSTDPLIRLRHGHGHTQHEMYAIKYEQLPRIPDLVVYPETEQQVVMLVDVAIKHDVCLIPYGGGTNVTEALQCSQDESRLIVSVDMKRLNRITWIDPINRLAHIEAGAIGRNIVATLEAYGFVLGHEPDSVEFSTLGGWIATNASGMKKNKYGNIEDLVMDVNVVTVNGLVKRSTVVPRESIGLNSRNLIFGSEGSLGIITSAVVRIFPKPQVQKYGSIIFPDFTSGFNFLYALSELRDLPASVRLVDNLQFQFSLALKPASKGITFLKSQLQKMYVTKVKKFKPDQMVACTLVFEGTKRDVHDQEARVYPLAFQHGGIKAGGENGKRGYQLTYGIAYIRDFVMNHFVLAESFETSVSWNQALQLCDNVKKRITKEHEARKLPGKPFITCRATQIYPTGVCIYFYFGFGFKGVKNPSQTYSEIEIAARDEILRSGGSLSHHHGIGKLRQRFLPKVVSNATLTWNKQAKIAADPKNIFGCRNQLLHEPINVE